MNADRLIGKALSGDARLAALAALWAQRLKLPAGNLWEPAIVRYMVVEAARLGGDASAYAFTEAMMAIRLGLDRG